MADFGIQDITYVGPANYTVYSDGTNWIAKNNKTGIITLTNSLLTTVLQHAIDNLTSSRTVIETVKIIGTGTVGKILIPSYIRLDVVDFDPLLTANTNDNWFTNADYTNGNTQIIIVGGLFDGNKANQSDTTTASQNKNIIYFEKVTDSFIWLPYCDNANNDGIRLKDCVNVKVDTPRVLNCRSEGLSIRGGSKNVVINPYFYNTGWSFMTSVESSDCQFIGGYGNVTNGSASGVNVSSVRNKVKGFVAKSTAGPGFVFGDSSGAIYDPTDSTYEDCVADTPTGPGFSCVSYPARNVHYVNCEAKNGSDYGFRFGGDVVSYSIINCRGHDNQKSGVLINGSSTGPVIPKYGQILGGQFYNNGKGLGTDQERSGICVTGDAADTVVDVLIQGALCYDTQGTKTQKYGVRLNNTNYVSLRFNDLNGNLTDGLQLAGTNNNLENLSNPGISTVNKVVANNQANTYGAFDQIIPSGNLKISNGANTGQFTASPLSGNRIWNMPNVSADMVGTGTSNTLTNKWIQGLRINYNPKTATYTALLTDDFIPVDATSGNVTINLPAVSGNGGKYFIVQKTDSSANTVTIDGNGAETINGATTFVITVQYHAILLWCDGTEWKTQLNTLERGGKATASGNGSTTVFNIAHGLGSTPNHAFVQCQSHNIGFTYATDATNITVTFASAPGSGTNNVIFNWKAVK